MILRPTDAPLLTAEDRIDEICDAYEMAWLRGERPKIIAFLSRAEEAERPALFTELVLVAIEYCREHGELLTRAQCLREFPKFAEQIEAIEFKQGLDSAADHFVQRSASPARPLAPGTRIARFLLLERLGAGAAGEVWRAQDTRLQREIAVKVPRSHDISESELHRFLREGRAMAQLRHPNIVPVHDGGRDGEFVFIVSDYVSGENLRQRLEHYHPTFHEAAQLCATLAAALHHAHEQGIVHRDLKPANVIVDRNGEPHITDFGLAKWVNDIRDLTLQGQLLGTVAYMSPEQASGQLDRIDRRTDVYAIGVLLYEMLTGRCPFQGDEAAVVRAIADEEPLPPRMINRDVPRDLETICLKAIEKNPWHRYASASHLEVDLRRFLSGEPILARRVGQLEKCWRWFRRRPAVAASIALLFLAIGSLVLAGIFARKSHELLGLQLVVMATEPPGAKVAFVPLSDTTGEPVLSAIKYARRRAPVREALPPGDYLVVAVMPDGRFHEAYRHVPGPSESITGAYRHRSSRRLADGTVQLRKIVIPDLTVTDGMAYIAGSRDFRMGVPGSLQAPQHRRPVDSFYMDTSEFTFGDLRRIAHRTMSSIDTRRDDWAVPVSYDRAVALAEEVGKRLPTEAEYEYAATVGGRTQYPWGNTFPEYDGPAEFGPVKSVAFDRMLADSPVHGLCSNLAEWTSSWATPYPPSPSVSGFITLDEHRIARGGSLATIHGDARVAAELRDPTQRCIVIRHREEPGLGFRCVRSAKPLVAYESFP